MRSIFSAATAALLVYIYIYTDRYYIDNGRLGITAADAIYIYIIYIKYSVNLSIRAALQHRTKSDVVFITTKRVPHSILPILCMYCEKLSRLL